MLAARRWHSMRIEVGGKTYVFYHRDMLDVGVDEILKAQTVQLVGEALPPNDSADRRLHTLNSDSFVHEQEEVLRLHGRHASEMGVFIVAGGSAAAAGACGRARGPRGTRAGQPTGQARGAGGAGARNAGHPGVRGGAARSGCCCCLSRRGPGRHRGRGEIRPAAVGTSGGGGGGGVG